MIYLILLMTVHLKASPRRWATRLCFSAWLHWGNLVSSSIHLLATDLGMKSMTDAAEQLPCSRCLPVLTLHVGFGFGYKSDRGDFQFKVLLCQEKFHNFGVW